MTDASRTGVIQFQSRDGDVFGSKLTIPVNVTTEQLTTLLNQLLQNVRVRSIYDI